jgi:hypothetical protein
MHLYGKKAGSCMQLLALACVCACGATSHSSGAVSDTTPLPQKQEDTTQDATTHSNSNSFLGGPTEKTSVHREQPATEEELLAYTKSEIAAVRLRVVRDLRRYSGVKPRLALEYLLLNDSNAQVRFAVIDELVARRSKASIPVLRRAMIAASVLRRAGYEQVEDCLGSMSACKAVGCEIVSDTP